jgi:hypothetical protein
MTRRPVSLAKTPIPRADRGTETTRHLCTGTYLDRTFRRTVLRDVLHDRRHRVAPSYGFDLVAVAHHAWHAWRLEAVQHAWVWTVLLATTALNRSAGAAVLCFAGLRLAGGAIVRLAPEAVAYQLKTLAQQHLHLHPTFGDRRDENRLQERKRLLQAAVGAFCALTAAPFMLARFTGTPVGLMLAEAALALLLIAIATGVVAALRDRSIARLAHRTRPETLNRRLRAIEQQQSHTVVVYQRSRPKESDEDDPLSAREKSEKEPHCFVGSGELVHRWLPPLAIQLLRPKRDALSNDSAADDMPAREYVTPPFQAHLLVDHLRSAMRPIGHSSDPIRLPGYHVWDRVFVAEPDVLSALVPPESAIDQHILNKIIDEPYGAMQHFLEICATSSGELVTTVFLRVTLKGRSLSLDFAACALARTTEEYQRPGGAARYGLGDLARSALSGFCRSPAEMAGALRLAAAPLTLVRAWRARSARAAAPATAPVYRLREATACAWEDAALDRPMILDQMKIIELRLLKATEDFLDEHDVDTSVFAKRAETIISASVLNMGGRVDISNSAVGDNAQMTMNMSDPVPEATP